jgi:hypothetical protein
MRSTHPWTSALLLGFALACGPGAGTVSLKVELANAIKDQVTSIEVVLVESCDGLDGGPAPATPDARRWVVAKGESPNLGNVPKGTGAFYARAYSADCRILGTGCLAFTAKAGDAAKVTLAVVERVPPLACTDALECTCSQVEDAGNDAIDDGDVADAPIPDGEVPPVVTLDWTATYGVGTCSFVLDVDGDAFCEADSLVITPAAGSQRSAAYAKQDGAEIIVTVDDESSFETEFTVLIDDTSDDVGDARAPADGFAFVVREKNAPRLGADRGAIGYQGDPTMSQPDVAPSVAVAFITYPDETLAIVRDGRIRDADPPQDFAYLDSFFRPKNLETNVRIPLAPRTDAAELVAPPFYVWVTYAGATNQLDVYVSAANLKPAAPLVSTTEVDLNDDVGSELAFGFTGGTGQFFQRARILSWHLKVTD